VSKGKVAMASIETSAAPIRIERTENNKPYQSSELETSLLKKQRKRRRTSSQIEHAIRGWIVDRLSSHGGDDRGETTESTSET
jgi:hypothetical protein